jgi:integrase
MFYPLEAFLIRTVSRALHNGHVFLYQGKPITDIRTGLRKTCKEASISYGRFEKSGFVFHDLRHTFNTNMRKTGVPESVIIAITGHSTRAMFDRYNTVDEGDLRKAIDQMKVISANSYHNSDHTQTIEK